MIGKPKSQSFSLAAIDRIEEVLSATVAQTVAKRDKPKKQEGPPRIKTRSNLLVREGFYVVPKRGLEPR